MAQTVDQTKMLVKEAEEWSEKQKLLQLSEISLVLDTYDDIFSDFDPRTFDKRALSDDLMAELKRATREKKSGVIELNFLIPIEQRRDDKEMLVRKRLREHFRKHYEQTSKAIDAVRKKGMAMIAIGITLSFTAAVFIYPQEAHNILNNLILVLIEPAAWFTIWEGANKVFDSWRGLEPDLEFYKKMSKCEVSFTGY